MTRLWIAPSNKFLMAIAIQFIASAAAAQAPPVNGGGINECYTPVCQCYRPCGSVGDDTESGAAQLGGQIGEALRQLLAGLFSNLNDVLSPPQGTNLSKLPIDAKTYHPTFDCSANLNDAEQEVCSNPILSKLDRQLGGEYVRLLTRLDRPNRRALAREEHGWMDRRDACDEDQACIAQAYTERIVEFRRRSAALDRPIQLQKICELGQQSHSCNTNSDCECSHRCEWNLNHANPVCQP
jgi:uncharacterized protein